MQETLSGFQVRCCASQRLHQARLGVHSCVQAAAAHHAIRRSFAGGRNISESTFKGDGVLVLCDLIADPRSINKRGKK